MARPANLSADTRKVPCFVTPLSSSRAAAIGSSSSAGSCLCSCFFLSGEATSKTLLPTFSWKFARGSTGSGLADRVASCTMGWRVPRPSGRVGLTFSLVFCLEAGAHVLRLDGVTDAGISTSGLLFLRPKGLLKKPRFFWKELSSIGLGSWNDDSGIGLPGEAEPLGGSTLEKELGSEWSLCESRLGGRLGL